MRRSIALVIHPGFQLLDAAGPATAFEIAERFRPGSYVVSVLAPGGGEVESSSGVRIPARPLKHGRFDTIVVAGGQITRSMPAFNTVLTWLKRTKARRIASVCTGAFVLAEAGLLDGRRATTHWSSTDRFRRRFPNVTLEADLIFVRDGNVWTSAGISAGIDLALALIENDVGAEIARRTAQQLVVHHRRPGGQSQFSGLVQLGGQSGRFSELIGWIRDHLAERLTVERLADRAAMSARHFARAFLAETGTTPAKAIERLRLEAARAAVENTPAPLEHVAGITGFGNAGRMSRAFVRAFGLPPRALRRTARAG